MGRPCVLRRRRYEKTPGRAAWRALAVPHARRFGNRHPVPGSEPLRGHVGSQRVRFLPPVGAGASIPHTLRHLRAPARRTPALSLHRRGFVGVYRRDRTLQPPAVSKEASLFLTSWRFIGERLRPPRSRERPGVNRRAFYNGHTEQNTMEVKLF